MSGLPAPFVLVPMRSRDLDQVLAIERDSFRNPWTRSMFVGELARGAISRAWVVRTGVDGPVIGYCLGWLVAGELHISNLAIAPSVRRRGAARWMLERVLAEAAADGGESATLEVRQSNTAALNLYSTLGFCTIAVRRRYYSDPEEDALVLWLDHLA